MLVHWFYLILPVSHICGNYYLPVFYGSMPNISAQRGQDVMFTCIIEHLGKNKVAFLKVDPPTLLTWQHKTFATKPHKYRLENRKDVTYDHWSLVINNVQASDSGAYMCQVGTSPMMSQTAYLSLKVPPTINAEKTKKDVVVVENQNMTIACTADGSPPPVISWMRKDHLVIITNDPVEGVGAGTIYSSNLIIYHVTRNHMTDYICLADNGVSPTESWTVKVHVHFAPTVAPLEQRVISNIGGDAELRCKAEAWPRPEFQWLVGENLILSNHSKFQQQVGSLGSENSHQLYESLSVLTIRDLTTDNFGAYTCVAKNDYGTHRATVELIKKEFSHENSENDEKSPDTWDINDVVVKVDEPAANDEQVDDEQINNNAIEPPVPNKNEKERNLTKQPKPGNSSSLSSLSLFLFILCQSAYLKQKLA